MKVFLAITNINGFHEIPYSFGLSSIASYIAGKGYEVSLEGVMKEAEVEGLLARIAEARPRVVGFTAVSSQFFYVHKIAQRIKQDHPTMITVCGGVHATLYPEDILRAAGFDYLFRGESEEAFAAFLDNLDDPIQLKQTPNLVYVENGKVIKNGLNPLLEDLDVLPHPAKGELFRQYIETNGRAPFFFSRGCPFLCSYCSNHALAKAYNLRRNMPRFRGPQRCIEEILLAGLEYKFDRIYFCDDTFGLNKKWRDAFLQEYAEKVKKPFVCLLRANVVDDRFIHQLKQAGCEHIQFGVESGNDHIRNSVMKRGLSNEQLIAAYDLCRKHGITTTALNIIGVPDETEEMIWDTIKLNRRLNPTYSGVNIFYPYRGTELGDYCFANNLVNLDAYEDFSNERRDSVLNYSPEWKAKLLYFHQNWERLVYPYNVKKQVAHWLRGNRILYGLARDAYRSFKKLFNHA
jgi:radical SAM superfamily enzyme YgiQ (UPF0313 family)